MNYKDYKAISEKLDESFFNLGLKTPHSVGAVGSQFVEEDEPADDSDEGSDEGSDDEGDEGGEDGQDMADMAAMVGAGDEGDDMGGDDMGGDEMGGDEMGGDDASMFGGGSPIASGPGLGRDDPGADDSDIDPASLDLDPHLMSLLGLGDLGVGEEDPMGGAAAPGPDVKHNSHKHVHHHIHHTMTPGAPAAGGKPAPDFGGDDEDGGDEEGGDDEGGNPFGKKGGDDKGGKKGGKPFGGKKGGDSEESDSDDSDSDSDDSDSDDKEYMHKCCPTMKKEDADFFSSLIKMGKSEANTKYKSGLSKVREEAMNDGSTPRKQPKARREPQAGEVGYAPSGKLGANFQVMPFSEWLKARGKKLNG